MHAVFTNLALFSGMHLAKGRRIMYIADGLYDLKM